MRLLPAVFTAPVQYSYNQQTTFWIIVFNKERGVDRYFFWTKYIYKHITFLLFEFQHPTHTKAPFHQQPRAWNQSQYSRGARCSKRSVRPDRYHQSHDNYPGASRKRAHFTWDLSSSVYGAGPSRTQGYPLSLGKIITLRRVDKSAQPGPYSPSAAPNQFIGIVMSRAHACCHARQAFFFFFSQTSSLCTIGCSAHL